MFVLWVVGLATSSAVISTWKPLPIVQSDEIAGGLEARSIDLLDPLSWVRPWNVASGYQRAAQVPLRAAQVAFDGILDPLTAGRMVHVACGALMTVGLLGFGQHLVGTQAAAAAAILLMVNHVHVHLSRAFICTGVQSAAGLSIVLWLLLSLRSGMSRRQWLPRTLLAGLLLGWTTQTYALAFAFPLLVCASVWLWRERLPGRWTSVMGALLVGSLPVLIPWLVGLMSTPEPLLHAGGLAARSWERLQYQTYRALTMWRIGPDDHANYGASMAVLDHVTGVLFALGIVQGIGHWRAPWLQVVALWLLALLVGAVIAVNNGAGYYRLSCSLLFVCLIAGRALWSVAERLRWPGQVAAVAALAAAGWINLGYLFVEYPTEVSGHPGVPAVSRACAGNASPRDIELIAADNYTQMLLRLQCPDRGVIKG